MYIKNLGIDPNDIYPLHDYVHVRRNFAPGVEFVEQDDRFVPVKDGVFLTDYEGDNSTYATILRIGPHCKYLTKGDVGKRACCSADGGYGWNPRTRRIQNEDFFVREEEIRFLMPSSGNLTRNASYA